MDTTHPIEKESFSMPQLPQPTEHHAWLAQFSGDWVSEVELRCSPGQTMETTGRERIRMFGGFWMVSESTSDSKEMPFSSIFSVGYDPAKERYIGTWIDTMTSRLWIYEGYVNEKGNILTLLAEGSCPTNPSKTRQYRERIEIVDRDHKIFTSSMQEDDGSWTTCVTVKARRYS